MLAPQSMLMDKVSSYIYDAAQFLAANDRQAQRECEFSLFHTTTVIITEHASVTLMTV